MKQQNDTINLKALTGKILGRWYLFAIFLPLSLAIAYLYMRFTPKVYEVKASLLVDTRTQNMPGEDKFLRGMGAFAPQTQLKDEIQLLTSYRYIKQVVDKLSMRVSYFSTDDYKTVEEFGHFPFRVRLDTTKGQMINVPIYIKRVNKDLYEMRIEGKKVKVYDVLADKELDELPEVPQSYRGRVLRVGQPYTDKYLNFTIEFSKNPSLYDKDEYFFSINSLSDQAANYQAALKVNAVDERNANVIELSLQGTVVEKEVNFLNTLLEVYLDNEIRRKNEEGKRTISYIDSELGVVQDSIRVKDVARQGEQKRTGTFNASASVDALNEQYSQFDLQLQDARAKADQYESLLRSLRNNEEVLGGVSGVDDASVSALLTEYGRLSQERARLSLSVQEGSLRMQQIDAKMQGVRGNLIDGLTSLRNTTKIRISNLNQKVGSIRSQLGSIPETDSRLMTINRKGDVQDELYKYLLQKRADAGMAIATNRADKDVIDLARPTNDGPVAPKGSVIYLLAGIIGLVIPLGFIFIRDAFSDRIAGQTDIQINTNIPTLGVIGFNNKANTYLVANSSKSTLAESFRSVRVNLQYLFLDTSKKIIGITSSQQAEGKTFCATNLAMVMAQSGKKTLLIDCDLRKPRVHSRFGVENEKGLATFLTGMHEWSEVVTETDTENLSLVTSGPIPVSPLNLIGGKRMQDLIEKLKREEEYDYIIIDTAPLGLVSDFLILKNYTDFNIYIVRHKVTEREALNKINELYDTNRLTDVAILINGVRSMSAYGYSDKAYKYSD